LDGGGFAHTCYFFQTSLKRIPIFSFRSPSLDLPSISTPPCHFDQTNSGPEMTNSRYPVPFLFLEIGRHSFPGEKSRDGILFSIFLFFFPTTPLPLFPYRNYECPPNLVVSLSPPHGAFDCLGTAGKFYTNLSVHDPLRTLIK